MCLSLWDDSDRDIDRIDEDERALIEAELLREEEERKRQMQLLLWEEQDRLMMEMAAHEDEDLCVKY